MADVHTYAGKEVKHIIKLFRKAKLEVAYKTKNKLNMTKGGYNKSKLKMVG
jgi:hypothetical protein